MKIHKQTIFDLIMTNAAKAVITHYYSYNTGTVGSSYIAEVENTQLTNEPAKEFENIVEKLLDEAVARLKTRRDNKTAVKCSIPGIAQPVYFVFYDTKYVACFQIDRREGTEYLVPAKKAEVPVGTPSGGHHGEGEE